MNNPPIDAAFCPICGRPNLCPMVVDPDASECWCKDKLFPPELLAQVPEVAAKKACICQDCLRKFTAPSERQDHPAGSS